MRGTSLNLKALDYQENVEMSDPMKRLGLSIADKSLGPLNDQKGRAGLLKDKKFRYLDDSNKENIDPRTQTNRFEFGRFGDKMDQTTREKGLHLTVNNFMSKEDHQRVELTLSRQSVITKKTRLTEAEVPTTSSTTRHSFSISMPQKIKLVKNPEEPSQSRTSLRIESEIYDSRPRGWDPIDQHFDAIFKHLGNTQKLHKAIDNPMKEQTEINKHMRVVLFNWLLKIHSKFRMKTRTFFLASNVFDRYLCLNRINRSKLQLVGVTALLIASKFEDIYPPEINDLCKLADFSFSREDVLEMEGRMLSAVNFNLVVITSFDALEVLARLWNVSEPQIILLATCVLHVVAVYHNQDKINTLKLGSFALLFAERRIDSPGPQARDRCIMESEYYHLSKKLNSLVDQFAAKNANEVATRFKTVFPLIKLGAPGQ